MMSCANQQTIPSHRVNACRVSRGFDPAALLRILHTTLPKKPCVSSRTALRSETDRHAAGMVIFRKIIHGSRGDPSRFGILVSDFESETILWFPHHSADEVPATLDRLRELKSGDLIRVRCRRSEDVLFLTSLQPSPNSVPSYQS